MEHYYSEEPASELRIKKISQNINGVKFEFYTASGVFSKDIDMHLRLMKMKRREFKGYLPLMTPYIFNLASSPHLAARREDKNIRISKIRRSLERLSKDFDIVLIEGSGGLLVPLNRKRLLIDVIKELRLSVLLVAQNRLGAINHTLLSVEALKARGIKIIGLIFNNVSKDTDSIVLKDNPRIIKELAGIEVLGTLPCVNSKNILHKRFTPLGNKITNRLWKTG